MEDQTPSKSQSLTLFVFAGIVVLCSIFFILGMVVGRDQGQKLAAIALAEAATEDIALAIPEEKPELTFFDSVETEEQPAALEPQQPEVPAISSAPAKAVPQPASSVLNYQVAALRSASDADKLLATVKQKGFKAFILAPSAGDVNRLYRVQVGPFANLIDAEDARKRLERAGYKPILKK